MLWLSSLAVLATAAAVVCPDGGCVIGAFDRGGLELAHALRSGWLDGVMERATWLGSLFLLLPLTAAGALLLLRAQRRRESRFVILALLGASALSHAFKLWVERPRPDLFPPWVGLPADWSFPSAHTMQAVAAALAWLLVARRARTSLALVLGLGALAVGLSRVYLQVHFPSDVVAGALAAALWVAGLHALMLRPGVRGRSDAGEGSR